MEWYLARLIAAVKNTTPRDKPADWRNELIGVAHELTQHEQTVEEALAMVERYFG